VTEPPRRQPWQTASAIIAAESKFGAVYENGGEFSAGHLLAIGIGQFGAIEIGRCVLVSNVQETLP
jgi:hypothetical protein